MASQPKGELQGIRGNLTKPGITTEEVIYIYDQWAANYDKDVESFGYNCPAYVAKEIDSIFKDNKSIRILDVGAGTGIAGKELVKLGFKHIDALDGSAAMIGEAKKLNIYENYYVELLGPKRISLPDNVYEAIVVSAGIGPTHIQYDCYESLIRILKPGGYIVVAISERILLVHPKWTNNLHSHMLELEQKGLWVKVAEKRVKDYMYKDVEDCTLFIQQKVD